MDSQVNIEWRNDLKQGDSKAFRKLYKDYYPMIRSYVLKNSGIEDDARDLFQESLLILVKALKENKVHENVKVSTYLYAVAQNLWKARHRKQKKEGTVILEEGVVSAIESDDLDLEGTIYKDQQLILMRWILESLKEDCKNLLNLAFYKLENNKGIAKLLNYSENYVKTKKYRCMQELISRIKDHPDYNRLKTEWA